VSRCQDMTAIVTAMVLVLIAALVAIALMSDEDDESTLRRSGRAGPDDGHLKHLKDLLRWSS
jgi:hypothetical protein